jgi:hypothetical protein
MEFFLLVLAIVLVAAGTLWLTYGKRPVPNRSRKPAADRAAPPRPGGIDKLKASKLFWGVELAQTGCEAARLLQGQQYTFEAAPELPLKDCSSAACTCQFRGLRDRRAKMTRRTHPDRRELLRFEVDKPDRRARTSRRRADKWTDHTL